MQCRRCGIWNAGYHAAWSHITEDEFNGFIDEESAIEAWNTRACDQCEGGAVPMTEENMAEHGWVRKRTCRPEEVYLDSHSDLTATVCSNCRVAIDELEECYYCPNCGAKVMEHD